MTAVHNRRNNVLDAARHIDHIRPSETHGPSLRILVCDRMPIMRDALCGFVRGETNMEVVGSTDSGTQALAMIHATHPNVVVTGMDLLSMSGLHMILRLRRENLELAPHVIAFTLGVDDQALTQIIHAGVSGVLAEDATRREVVAAINAAIAGHMTLAPQLAQRLVDWFRQHNGYFDDRLKLVADTLTSREREVLRLMADGRTMEQIAEDLCIEMTTVRTHVYRMRTKLSIQDRAQLVSFAYRAGLMQPS
jgi:DNA-binding NarL/FixJ family response regulator